VRIGVEMLQAGGVGGGGGGVQTGGKIQWGENNKPKGSLSNGTTSSVTRVFE